MNVYLLTMIMMFSPGGVTEAPLGHLVSSEMCHEAGNAIAQVLYEEGAFIVAYRCETGFMT